MRPRVLAPIAVVALLGAACGGQPAATPATRAPATTTSDAPVREPTPATTSVDPTPPSPPTTDPEPDEPAAPATVSMTDFDFDPATVEVVAGSTVTWTNDGSVAHTATVDDGLDTGTLASGESGTITFTEPGTYDYVCQFHPADMQAVVVVR